MRRACALLSLYAAARASPSAGGADAWSPSSRFVGLRFECAATGEATARRLALALRDEADELEGFGWVQVPRAHAVVGEWRGSVAATPAFERALARSPADGGACDVRRYSDTVIRFHFADFRLLEDASETCFDEPPHACAAASEAVPASP